MILADAIDDCKALAEKLDAPVACGYQHNDSFPGSHPLAVGPLGYNGSKAGMEIISKADVVLALGTRLNPFQHFQVMELITGQKRQALFKLILIQIALVLQKKYLLVFAAMLNWLHNKFYHNYLLMLETLGVKIEKLYSSN